MRMERLSRNETALSSATPAAHKSGSEKYVRRGAEQRSYRALDADTANAKAQAKQRYPRYIPSATVTQLLVDLLLIAGSQAAVLTLIRSRLDITSAAQTFMVVGFSTLLSLVLLYATG